MTHEFPMVFQSKGVPLAARVYRNVESLEVRQPGVIAMGSWLTVKEQMATTYARRLAETGVHGVRVRFLRIRRERR
jgi:uncharacterized protein